MNTETGLNVTMSDNEGNLLFYSNGCYVANFEDDTMDNGTGINPGYVHNLKCPGEESYGYTSGFQSGIALPIPDTQGVYVVFHKRIIYVYNPFDVLTDQLLYSVVDMNLNGGKGRVTAKNVVAIADSVLCFGDLSAVRHANGRDWWIISPGYRNNNYFILLLTKNKIASVVQQQLGDSTPALVEGGGQSFFTPDGGTYIHFNVKNNLRIFDFDRATGILSHYRKVNVDFGDLQIVDGGCGISPSGRFLYISARKRVFQMDMQAADISASQQFIAEWDGYADPIACDFGRIYSGPDCKLYIATGNDAAVLHVIHHPEEPGLACNLEQHGLHTPTYHGASFPNFPNYRLRALGEPFSPCKGYTVGAEEVPPSPLPVVSVFPNPASEYVKIIPNRPLPARSRWVLCDAYGREVRSEGVGDFENCVEADVRGLAGGVYFWSLVSGDQQAMAGGKLVVRR